MKVKQPIPGKPNAYHWVEVPDPTPAKGARAPNPAHLKPECIHFGERLPSQPCGAGLHLCTLDGAKVTRVAACKDALRTCQTCTLRPTGAPPLSTFAAEFAAAVERLKSVTYPEDRYRGRGIVIPAGGWGQLPGVYVTAKMLRWEAVNSRLPIEVWYIGDEGEHDPLFDHLTGGLGMTWRNVSAELRRLGVTRTERLHGWAVKPLLPLLSSFEQVVMMDADCYPVYDPERLFDDPRIGDASAAFWQDNHSAQAGRPLNRGQWALFGMDMPREVIPGFESGQMVVDKRRSWHAVQLAAWLSDRFQEFDATRGKVGGFHGDKEVFSVAWRATNTPYHMAQPVRYHEVAFLQHDPAGEVCFVHRCNDKPRVDWQDIRNSSQKFTHTQFRSTTLPHEHMFHRYLQELRYALRPNLPGFRDHTQDVQVWHEVHTVNAYRLPKRMDGWKVLDVGAHVGLFALECLQRGAAQVVCVEPFRPNNELLRQNVAPWAESGRIAVVDAAVATPGVTSVRFTGSENGERYNAEPHVTLGGGIEVPAVSLDTLIERFAGDVDLLKLDCEGSEWAVLPSAKLLGRVKRIALEWHTTGVPNRPDELRELLESQGFAVEVVPGGANGMLFAAQG